MLHKSIEPPPVSNLGDTVPESIIADVGKQLAAEVAIGAKPQTPAHDGRAKPADEATAQTADISFEDLQVDAATESAAHAAATEYANAGFDVYPPDGTATGVKVYEATRHICSHNKPIGSIVTDGSKTASPTRPRRPRRPTATRTPRETRRRSTDGGRTARTWAWRSGRGSSLLASMPAST